MRQLLTTLTAAASLALGLLAAPAASADPSPTGRVHASDYYLALGDSLAAGYQPGHGDDKAGGYVAVVRDAVAARHRKTRLVNLSCSGETVASMLDGGRCAYDEGSQVAAARAFLRAHGRFTRVVTIDIGANDVQRCVAGGDIDYACLQRGLTTVGRRLPRILAEVKALAPHAKVVVLTYYNPFLAAWLTGADGRRLALTSAGLQTVLNTTITASASATGWTVADIAAAFESSDWSTTTLPGGGEVPRNVATLCSLTWMCTQGDIHANDTGYTRMGQAVAAVLR